MLLLGWSLFKIWVPKELENSSFLVPSPLILSHKNLYSAKCHLGQYDFASDARLIDPFEDPFGCLIVVEALKTK